MSNSIWKTPDQKPEKEPIIIRCANGAIISCPSFVIRKFSDGDTWAYLHEVVNQADKAERLEKENEAMREEFEVWHGNHKCVLEDNERLQKAVDLAVEALKKAETTRELTVKGHYVHAISLDELHSALVEIKQLIKGE